LQQNSDDIDLLMLKAVAYREQQQSSEARECFEHILNLILRMSWHSFNIGKLDLAKSDWAAAAAAFSRALEIAPQLPELSPAGPRPVRIGRRRRRSGGFFTGHPRPARPGRQLLLRARAAEKLGDYEHAVTDAGKAIALGSHDLQAHLLIARNDEKQAAWDAVIQHSDRVLEISPNNTEALRLRGRALLARRADGGRTCGLQPGHRRQSR